MKIYLNKILVVEGKEDASYLSNYIASEIVIVNGYELNETTINYLKDKEVLLLLDPDEAGLKIRKSLNEVLPNCTNVEVDIKRCTRGTKNGVAECEIDEDYNNKEREILPEKAKNDPKNAGKPENILQKVVEGGLNKELKEVCLLNQIYIMAEDGKQTIEQYVAEVAKKQNANIKVLKFIRFETGEGIEKKQEDFAAEVAKQMGN